MNVNKRISGREVPAPLGYVTAREAARRLNMHRKAFLRAVKRGTILVKSELDDGSGFEPAGASRPSWIYQRLVFPKDQIEVEATRLRRDHARK